MRLVLPAFDNVQLVRTVVAERASGVNAAYFVSIVNEWVTRTEAYLANRGQPHQIPRWPTIQPRSNTFLNLYLTPAAGSAQGRALDALRDHDLTICPACGEPGRPNTLDHYLPKSDYPHFCITPANLLPMCDACQLAKDVKIGDAATPRFFIHPYFDTFVAEQVFQLIIKRPFHAPSIELIPVDGLGADESTLVRTHLRELEIGTRYAKYFRVQYRRLLRLVSKMRLSKQPVQGTLETFKHGAGDESLNSWDHVLYAAALENADLLDYLTNEPLPDYL